MLMWYRTQRELLLHQLILSQHMHILASYSDTTFFSQDLPFLTLFCMFVIPLLTLHLVTLLHIYYHSPKSHRSWDVSRVPLWFQREEDAWKHLCSRKVNPRENLEKAEYFLIFLVGLGKIISSIRIEFLAYQKKRISNLTFYFFFLLLSLFLQPIIYIMSNEYLLSSGTKYLGLHTAFLSLFHSSSAIRQSLWQESGWDHKADY